MPACSISSRPRKISICKFTEGRAKARPSFFVLVFVPRSARPRLQTEIPRGKRAANQTNRAKSGSLPPAFLLQRPYPSSGVGLSGIHGLFGCFAVATAEFGVMRNPSALVFKTYEDSISPSRLFYCKRLQGCILSVADAGWHNGGMNRVFRPRRKRFSRQQQQQWAAQFLESDLSQREFALAHGLGVSTLQRWIAQSRGKAWAAGATSRRPKAERMFVELKAPPAWPRWAAEVVRADGWILRLAHDVPATLLQSLISSC